MNMPTPNRLHKSGALVKRGGVRKNWKSRWFVVDPDRGVLTYFEHEGDKPGSVKGTIDLHGATVLDCTDRFETHGKNHCFGLETKGRTYFMSACDPSDCREWSRILGIVIRKITPGAAKRGGGATEIDGTASFQHGWRSASSQSHTRNFIELRRIGKHVPEAESERRNKIERVKNRVDKLLQRFFEQQSGRDSDEAKAKSVVPWAHPAATCTLCRVELPTGIGDTFKFIGAVINDKPVRANCWVCGASVCDRDSCSEMLVLQEIANFLGLPLPADAATVGEVAIRGCRTCKDIVQDASGRSKFGANGSNTDSALMRAYTKLRTQQEVADRLMPEFNDAVGSVLIQDVVAAKALRKELTDCFVRVTTLATQIEGLQDCKRGLQRQVAAHIKRAAVEWVQPRSFTLQSLSLKTK